MNVLCVCSAGMNRSRHLAGFLHEHGYETDFAGVHPLSTNRITQHRIDWADVIICVKPWMKDALKDYHVKKVLTIDVPNSPKYYPDMERAALSELQTI